MKKRLLFCIFSSTLVGNLLSQYNITFELNTELISSNIDPTGIYLAGGSGFGVPGDNLLTDADGDGIYTITVMRDEGFSSHYTFLNGNCGDWSCKESIGGLPCADPANFNDRFLPELMSDVTIQACFGNCADDGTCEMSIDSIDITFELNTTLITVDPEGVYVAGGGNFGNPGDNQLLDPDGDGIYSATIRKPSGFSSFYTFTNGACEDYTCKENIAGLPCADPANFNDRFFAAATEDTVVKACFGTCDDDGTCTIITDSIEITFELNTELIEVDPSGIFIAGGGNFGVPGDNPMIDPDGDGIYTYTTTRALGFSSHYTFLNGNCGDWSCKEDLAGLECADPNAFNDRFLESAMENMTIQACYGNCANDGTCVSVGTNDLISDPSLFELVPTVARGFVDFRFGDLSSGIIKNIAIVNIAGQRVFEEIGFSEAVHTVNVSGFSPGIYFANVQTEKAFATKKFIVK